MDFQEFLKLVQDVWQNGLYGIDVGQITVAVGILLLFLLARNLLTRFNRQSNQSLGGPH